MIFLVNIYGPVSVELPVKISDLWVTTLSGEGTSHLSGVYELRYNAVTQEYRLRQAPSELREDRDAGMHLKGTSEPQDAWRRTGTQTGTSEPRDATRGAAGRHTGAPHTGALPHHTPRGTGRGTCGATRGGLQGVGRGSVETG